MFARTRHTTLIVAALLSLSLWLALAGHGPAAAQDTIRILFMHHSTGQGVITEGALRDVLTALGYEFWDHGYNGDGLTDNQGNALGVNWDVPGDNTDPDGWAAIFAQPVTQPPANTFSHMLEFDVILFKSCFPTSNIESDEQLEAYRAYYLAIRDVVDQHPDKLFIPFTSPPLTPDSTSPEAAERAKLWAAYLASPDFGGGHPNLAVFDFFSLLADENGNLRTEYRVDPYDSHPNTLANQTIGPILADFVDQAIRAFTPGAAPVIAATESAPATPVPVTVGGVAGQIADFEPGTPLGELWTYENEGVKGFTCDVAGPGADSPGALQMVFDIKTGGSAGCGVDLSPDPAWGEAAGIALMLYTDTPGVRMQVQLGVGDPAQTDPDVEGVTPFAFDLTAGEAGWQAISIGWPDLYKPDWVGETGVDVFDPAQVEWIGFGVGDWQSDQRGALRIDDIRLLGEMP